MAFSLLDPENVETQDRAVSIECQPVVYPGVSSTLKYKDFEIEMKRNEGKLTEIWSIVPKNPSACKFSM